MGATERKSCPFFGNDARFTALAQAAVTGRFVPKTFSSLERNVYIWTIRSLDVSFLGRFVLKTIRTLDDSFFGRFVLWTFRSFVANIM